MEKKKEMKAYILVIGLIAVVMVIVGVSYSIFSVQKEEKGKLTIIVGDLVSNIRSTELNSSHQITVPAGQTKTFDVTLENTNAIDAKYSLYYKGTSTLPDTVQVGYLSKTIDVPPTEDGVVIAKEQKKVMTLVIENKSTSSVTIECGSEVGFIYNPLPIPTGYQAITKKIESKTQPAPPELEAGMIPVTWNGSNWVKADTSKEWYDYSKQNWANTVTVSQSTRNTYLNASAGTVIPMSNINVMWVWIPRYSYTIGNTYGRLIEGGSTPSQATPGAIDIKFVKKTDTLENGTAQYTGDTPTSWYTHPAFCFGTLTTPNDRTTCNGTEVNGIWVAKFEMSTPSTDACSTSSSQANCNKTNVTPMSLPNASSWRNITVGSMYNVIKNNMNGSTGYNTYGLNTTAGDTHMMKNMEWGAVAYLTQSEYGKYGNTSYSGARREVYINNYYNDSNLYKTMTMTGCSAGAPSTAEATTCAYTYEKNLSGTGASSTGTIYGIYDLSGGAWEYVMGNYNGTEVPFNEMITFPDQKYWDKYTGTTGYKGDATNADGTSGWYGDSTDFVTFNFPWFGRSGFTNRSTNAGVFMYYHDLGTLYTGSSFRAVRISGL